MSTTCPVCDGATEVLLRGLYDDRFGFPGRFTVLDCCNCGHRHLDGSFTSEELRRLYSDFYPRSIRDTDSFRPYTEPRGFRAWFAGERASAYTWVPRNVRVLDIGCGFGETLAYYRDRGCEAYGVEADQNILRVGERYGLNVRAGLFDPADYDPESFDYITLDQVIEHVDHLLEFMRGVATVLKPGGQVIISTPNSHSASARFFSRRWINWHVPYHLQQFSKRSLGLLAMQSGLEVESIRTLTNSAWLQYQWLHLWSRPLLGDPSSFWDSERSGRSLPGRVERSGRILWRWRAFHVTTRALDALGCGDNYLCFMRKPLR